MEHTVETHRIYFRILNLLQTTTGIISTSFTLFYLFADKITYLLRAVPRRSRPHQLQGELDIEIFRRSEMRSVLRQVRVFHHKLSTEFGDRPKIDRQPSWFVYGDSCHLRWEKECWFRLWVTSSESFIGWWLANHYPSITTWCSQFLTITMIWNNFNPYY